jgi:hypothetical protein
MTKVPNDSICCGRHDGLKDQWLNTNATLLTLYMTHALEMISNDKSINMASNNEAVNHMSSPMNLNTVVTHEKYLYIYLLNAPAT